MSGHTNADDAPQSPLPELSWAQCTGGSTTLLLCATPRLAQALRLRHAQQAQALGLQVWEPLQCLTLAQWLAQWRETWALTEPDRVPLLQRHVLSNTQEKVLWQRVIRQSLGDDATHLFDLAHLAHTAQEAHLWQTVWQLPVPTAALTQEQQHFERWRQRFLAECTQQGWITAHELDAATAHALAGPVLGLPWPQQVICAGFNRFNPTERVVLDGLQACGVHVAQLSDPGPASTQEVHSYPDLAAECLAAATWVQAQQQRQPDAHLAIVAPDLAACRQMLHEALEDVLAPWLVLPEHAPTQRPFNFSLGRPLSDCALVGSALQWLDLLAQPQPAAQAALSRVLLSPYSGNPAQAAARAQLDAHMRRHLQAQCHWSETAELARTRAPELWPQMQALAHHAGHRPTAQAPSAWAAWIMHTLTDLGWLAQQRLSSHEFQQHSAWAECIAELASLDALAPTLTLPQAVHHLRSICRERIFQPQTQGQPKLEVLGLLEACGQRFDAVWVMGLHAATWPPAIRPNPLLPLHAQQQARSPNASADVQLSYANQVQQHLQRAAAHVVWSWPQRDANHPHQPSPLLATVPPTSPLQAPIATHWSVHAQALASTALAPRVADTQAPPMTTDEAVAGGTALLRAQAICPAWGYYRYRLGAAALGSAADGLAARERGTLLHTALQHLWQTLGDSQQLHATSPAQMQAIIAQACTAAWSQYTSAVVPAKIQALETRRLQRLLHAWMAAERARSVAFSVVATEQRQTLDCNGLTLQMQIDRIDQLADGQHLVIDYKTGANVNTANWADERLSEPQLPLYATWLVAQGELLAGIAFAQVLLRDAGWAGLCHSDSGLRGVALLDSTTARKRYPAERFATWHDVVAHWQHSLAHIAQEIQDGHAAVRVHDETLLAYCDVLPLLRLSERRQQWLDQERS